jgi:hypothetical protein
MALFPLFNFQVRLKEVTLGHERWAQIKYKVDDTLDMMRPRR